MSSKQKIAISAIGIVLVLAIIGLTIGLVLVAAQATSTNSMKVTYGANHVACTIVGAATGTGINPADITATHESNAAYNTAAEGQEAKTDKIVALATENVAGTIKFTQVEITAADGEVQFTFTITNDGETGSDAIYAHATLAATGEDHKNMTVLMGADGAETAVTTYDTPAIEAGQSATISITVKVTNPGTSATWNETSMGLTVNKTATLGA